MNTHTHTYIRFRENIKRTAPSALPRLACIILTRTDPDKRSRTRKRKGRIWEEGSVLLRKPPPCCIHSNTLEHWTEAFWGVFFCFSSFPPYFSPLTLHHYQRRPNRSCRHDAPQWPGRTDLTNRRPVCRMNTAGEQYELKY